MASMGVGLDQTGSGLAAFDKSDGLADTAAQIVVHHQARVFAQAGRRLGAVLEMLARERADDQPARADERGHGLAERHAANDSA